MANSLVFLADDLEQPMTAEQFLRRRKGISHRMLVRLKHTPGGICCNGKPIRTIDPISSGDRIVLTEPEQSSGLTPSSHLHVPILTETASYILYNKPPGMPVHPSQGHHNDTLGNVFAAAFPTLPFRPVYRLDRDTSGICLIAKSAYSAKLLQGQIQKRYLALVCGILTSPGTVNAPIARESDSIIRRCVRADGKPAVTHFVPLGNDDQYTLLELTLETGRTHQIRVHMAHLGYPLAGDSLYGGDLSRFQRHMLHCASVEFSDPDTHEMVSVTCPWDVSEQPFPGISIPYYDNPKQKVTK